MEITEEQSEALENIERENNGVLVLAEDEYQALLDGYEKVFVELASREDSNLRHLFCWDDSEAASLYRQRQMHGNGN